MQMECEQCGQHGDWVGEGSDWSRAGAGTAAIALFECENCGHRQRGR